jgi:hypothetical protein
MQELRMVLMRAVEVWRPHEGELKNYAFQCLYRSA